MGDATKRLIAKVSTSIVDEDNGEYDKYFVVYKKFIYKSTRWHNFMESKVPTRRGASLNVEKLRSSATKITTQLNKNKKESKSLSIASEELANHVKSRRIQVTHGGQSIKRFSHEAMLEASTKRLSHKAMLDASIEQASQKPMLDDSMEQISHKEILDVPVTAPVSLKSEIDHRKPAVYSMPAWRAATSYVADSSKFVSKKAQMPNPESTERFAVLRERAQLSEHKPPAIPVYQPKDLVPLYSDNRIYSFFLRNGWRTEGTLLKLAKYAGYRFTGIPQPKSKGDTPRPVPTPANHNETSASAAA